MATNGAEHAEDARLATPSDLGAVADLLAGALAALEGARDGALHRRSLPLRLEDPHVLARLVETGEWAAFAGLYAGTCVGAALVRLEALGADRLASILLLYVEPAAREVGVGRRLVDEVAAWAAGEGCSGLDVATLPGDRLTKRLLEAAGHRARLVVMHRRLEGRAAR